MYNYIHIYRHYEEYEKSHFAYKKLSFTDSRALFVVQTYSSQFLAFRSFGLSTPA